MGQTSEDSVEAEFGGDYSEATLDMLRSLGRKGPQFGELDSAEEAALKPPSQALCDAAVAGLKEYERVAKELAQHVPDERELGWVDYKRALVQGASPQELTWLKLKAYYRGMDALRASREEDAAGNGAAPPAGMAAVEAAGEQSGAASSSSLPERDAVLAAVRQLLPSSSGEEEDSGSPVGGVSASTGWAPRVTPHAAAGPAPGATSESLALAPAPSKAGAGTAKAAAASRGAAYEASYLEEEALSRRVADQRRQRSQAFVLSLSAAIGASVVRWMLRRGRGPRSGAAADRPVTPQPPTPVAQ